MDNKFVGKGKVLTEPKLYYIQENTNYYIFEMGIRRNSNYEDRINIVSKESNLAVNQYIEVTGRFCSYNKKREDGTSKLFLFVNAEQVSLLSFEENLNKIEFEGYVVKKPSYRITPLGREICDVILACNREESKRSEYIPVIIWDAASKLAANLNVGDRVNIFGRVQSRIYTKNNQEMTAYEVSAIKIHF